MKRLHLLIRNPVLWVFIVNFILCLVTVYLMGRRTVGDDMSFQRAIPHYANVMDWVVYRYQYWSGRVIPEALTFILNVTPIALWKLLQSIMFGLFSVAIYMFVRLFLPTRSNISVSITLASVALPWIIGWGILSDAVFWVTGSFNYFWIVTAGMFAIYPFIHVLCRGHFPKHNYYFIAIPAAIIAANQEQIALICLGIATVIGGYLLAYERHKFKQSLSFVLPIALYLVLLITFVVGYAAPGNDARTAYTVLHTQPDFYTAPLLTHLSYVARWVVDALINQLTVFMLAIWVGACYIIFTKKSRDPRFTIVGSICLALITMTSLKSTGAFSQLFEFFPSWAPSHPSLLSYVTTPLWAIVIAGTCVLPIIISRSRTAWLLASTFTIATASIAVMGLSPSMHLSGLRTLYPAAIVLSLVAIWAIIRVHTHLPKSVLRSIITTLVILALLNYVDILHNISLSSYVSTGL